MSKFNSTNKLFRNLLENPYINSIKALRQAFSGEVSSAPKKPMITFTFDDGNLSDYTHGFRYMQQRGMRGTLFIDFWRLITPGQGARLSEAQIKEMSDKGWEIGCHTYGHPYLTQIVRLTHGTVSNEPFRIKEVVTSNSGVTGRVAQVGSGYITVDEVNGGEFAIGDVITGATSGANTTITEAPSVNNEDVLWQLTANKMELERITGKTVYSLAYPYGNYDDRVVNLVGAVYWAAAYQQPQKPVNYGFEDGLYRLIRYFIDEVDVTTVKAKIDEVVAGQNQWLIFGLHAITDERQDRLGVAEWEEIIDYTATHKIAGNLDVVTFREGALRIL